MNGNQFTVMDELVTAFETAHPDVGGVFCETIPPGVLSRTDPPGKTANGHPGAQLAPDVTAAALSALAPLHAEGA